MNTKFSSVSVRKAFSRRLPALSIASATCVALCAVAVPSAMAQSQAGFYAGWPSIYPSGYVSGFDYPLYSTEPPKPPAAPSGLDLTTQRAIPHAKFVEWATPTSERGYARVIPREEPRIEYW